ncbi:ABC transporter permease subunit, partial [Acinetobacter baumannii]|nr:ABC transporter permease subunit [Acinetobacter baumannii]
GISLIFSFVCAIPLGLLAGKNQNKLIDKIINMFVYFGISIPGFWFGLLLIITFSLKLHWLPSNGMRTVGDGSLLDIARHMVLPVIV